MNIIGTGYIKRLTRQLQSNINKHGYSTCQAIRAVVNANPDATREQLMIAGTLAKLNTATVKTQFYRAKKS